MKFKIVHNYSRDRETYWIRLRTMDFCSIQSAKKYLNTGRTKRLADMLIQHGYFVEIGNQAESTSTMRFKVVR